MLLGDPHQIHASNPDIDFTGIELVDPKTSPKLESYAALLYELSNPSETYWFPVNGATIRLKLETALAPGAVFTI